MASRRERRLSPSERLALDIDLRMHAVMIGALTRDSWDPDAVAGFLRLAYGAGYTDALSEPVRGQLCLDHGYRLPHKRRMHEGS